MKDQRVALFTMSDLEQELYGEDFAEFAEKKNNSGLGRKIATGLAAGVGLAAAGRYGGAGIKGALSASKGFYRSGGKGVFKKAGAAAAGFGRGVRRAGSNDARRVSRLFKRGRKAGGRAAGASGGGISMRPMRNALPGSTQRALPSGSGTRMG